MLFLLLPLKIWRFRLTHSRRQASSMLRSSGRRPRTLLTTSSVTSFEGSPACYYALHHFHSHRHQHLHTPFISFSTFRRYYTISMVLLATHNILCAQALSSGRLRPLRRAWLVTHPLSKNMTARSLCSLCYNNSTTNSLKIMTSISCTTVFLSQCHETPTASAEGDYGAATCGHIVFGEAYTSARVR